MSITIPVHDTALNALPAALEARLNKEGSPTKTPDELADALTKHNEKTAKLRNAHLDAVRDRAARESQRASEATARKLRLAAAKLEKVKLKLSASENKVNAKRDATEAERDARKQRREEMSLAVAEARAAAIKSREARAVAFLEAEKSAFFKRSKTVQSVVDKSHWQVKHAIAVAVAQKEKERADAAAAGEKLTDRLEKAAARKSELTIEAPGGGHSANSSTNSSPKRRHRVLNDDKVSNHFKRKAFELKEDRAASKREAILQAVASKARAELARVDEVVESGKARKAGTDAETAASKAAMYERLIRAEVARLRALKLKYGGPAHGGKHGDTISVIVVKVDKTPRMPPAALSLRLGAVSKKLVETASARQSGAAARRKILKAQATLKAAKHSEKCAAALGRIGKAQATKEAAMNARDAHAIVTLGLAQGAAIAVVARNNSRQTAATQRRAASAKALTTTGDFRAKIVKLAAERHAAKLRTVAKAGVLAVKAAASKHRRDTAAAATAERAKALAARAVAASEVRAAVLATRVAVAKKRMVAMHPKREVADMEIKLAA